MNRFQTVASVFTLAALSFLGTAQGARAADPPVTANINLNLQIGEYLNIEVDETSVTVVPTLSEIIAETVTRNALFNLINIQSTGNYDVLVSGDNAGITNTDIVLDAGDGDVTVPATGSAPLLTNKTGPVNDDAYPVDVTINNLQNYPAGTYSTNLTFEITSGDGPGA